MSVDGLACPFCAFGLERKLEALSGVDEVAVDLGEGLARFTVAGGAVVLPEAIRDAVRDAG
ncbi:MAG: heavy-metal-associated domain-containing protein, partial [Deltaproteobacteria bacterium]|nr:heavy-metal-associated domain-containing protein [Deltaproteobacteria bacterium]